MPRIGMESIRVKRVVTNMSEFNIKQRLEQARDTVGLPTIYAQLCADALTEIVRLERFFSPQPAHRKLQKCTCKAGQIVEHWSTDGDWIWCAFCGRREGEDS